MSSESGWSSLGSQSTYEGSPEYNTLVQCYSDLIEVVKHVISELGNRLFAAQLISSEINNTLALNQPPLNKAKVLIDCIKDQAKIYSSVYHSFIEALRLIGPFTKLIVQSLTACYESQRLLQKRLVYVGQPDNTDAAPGTSATTINTDSKLQWSDNSGNTIAGVNGGRDILFLVPYTSSFDSAVVQRRHGISLTDKEMEKLEEQGIHGKSCCNDLTMMMARQILDKRSANPVVISSRRDLTWEKVKSRIVHLMSNTEKPGVVLYYIGPGKKGTGDWCFSDGFISFREIMDLYTPHFRGRVLTIVSDCSYSGSWVREAMTFMDEQGVGPCGHMAKEKEILVKVYASCQPDEIPAELAFSTHCVMNDKSTGEMIYNIHLESPKIYENQHPSGLDFTGIRCSASIDQHCCMKLESWRKWRTEKRICVIKSKEDDKQVNYYLEIEDGDSKDILQELVDALIFNRVHVRSNEEEKSKNTAKHNYMSNHYGMDHSQVLS